MTDYFNVDPAEIDLLMGTFTKSFGAAGGYMASSKAVIDYIRATSFAMFYENSMPPAVAAQTLAALRSLRGEDGTNEGQKRITQLRENSLYFRQRLHDMKLTILGVDDSPVIPLLIYHPFKLPMFSRMCLERGLAVVVVSFPATPLLLGRARICLSSSHTREDLDNALKILEEVSHLLMLQYERSGWDRVKAILWK